ncbi:cardiolipin synthase [Breznakia sp. PF5-3]|uniref:cardiolipin synthase n=1 Tax=unclassified Breznakia TaxID=2623764 RepID=UPI0024068936|nr:MULTISPECIES: cardiolipin synthase [unclassified Breznakia]MDL2276277.1 cardiolipin synthase [Breznakia sp. OttesenSCG-928-G09]MDF9825563.1 cardiolipin synthase [Breznakia sp. PM6-1]MDF9835870.1 cardiolipin synthase [Breznakia sp. PF5-3]MDF9837615.1 cardiolipin synthase [Breznakia sp. PFB2-8]MDF9860004.1 cardiolipin synthase [Breznakia sp. PH5-24]
MKRLLRLLTNKLVIVGFLIMAQLAIMLLGVYVLSMFSINAYMFFNILSLIVGIYVINRSDNPSYKLSWAVVIIGVPIFGWLLYLIFGAKQVPKALRVRDHDLHEEMLQYIEVNQNYYADLASNDSGAYKQINYIWNASAFPPYGKTKTTFFATGEDNFAAMIDKLNEAKDFIFLEYFIIDEGYMWNTILEILERKVKEGVDVRLMYDDFGCASKLPNYYDRLLNAKGIKTKVFNPIHARLAVQMNNRDHRKIFIVDGKVGMSGGVNLADEYINRIERFGHWKDGGIMLEGEAVWSFTLMFLQFWNFDEEDKDVYANYRVDPDYFKDYPDDGLVQPFSDTPTDDQKVGEYTHINMINNADDYVYITTPYLVIDEEMKTSLILAAKNGVDVRILVPHIPDKWYVFQLTRYNYEDLTKNGVKIYEYTPGFIHAKNFVADDKYAIVGTTNMDFRSYYLHYECGVWMYRSKAIKDIKEDYLQTLKVSKEITYEMCKKVRLPIRIVRALLNILAPLM